MIFNKNLTQFQKRNRLNVDMFDFQYNIEFDH